MRKDEGREGGKVAMSSGQNCPSIFIMDKITPMSYWV